eukprot:g3167.t1
MALKLTHEAKPPCVLRGLDPKMTIADLRSVAAERFALPAGCDLVAGWPPVSLGPDEDTKPVFEALKPGSVVKVNARRPVAGIGVQAVRSAMYMHADGRRERVEIRKEHAEGDGGGFTIFVPSAGRERSTVSERLVFDSDGGGGGGAGGGGGNGNGDGDGDGDGAARGGGAIEMRVLAGLYSVEICAVDVETGKSYNFLPGGGDGASASVAPRGRVFLVYTGIHYDACALAPGGASADESADVRVLPRADIAALAMVQRIAAQLRAQRDFVNVHKFELQCMVCGAGIVGQADAARHAAETGHANYGEVQCKSC